MKMPEPVGYLSHYNLEMLKQGYPQTIVMLKGAKRDLPLYDKQALIDLLEEAAVDVMTHGKSDYPAVFAERLRKLKETL